MARISDFKECATCAAKPGAPDLCESCQWNRWIIQRLCAVIASYRQADEHRVSIENRIEEAANEKVT